jgi:hypothetical protein
LRGLLFFTGPPALHYKQIKKTGEFVLPGFGKLVKQKRKARTGFNPKTQQKIKIPAKTLSNFGLPRPQRMRFWGKEVVKRASPGKAAAFDTERLHRTPGSVLKFQKYG